MKKLLAILLLTFTVSAAKALPDVPEKIRFCNLELSLDQGARTKVAETVAKLKRSKVYFQALTDRVNIYLPFVEEAFELRGVPQDLKYIVIQESALVADAVSPSNAVGFWQFKSASARESGLVIDDQVDERKHIFLASLGAAKYFYSISKWYDNYLYAVVGYNRGPVGALPYTDVDDFGAKKMKITSKTHWYALKAIAHKLAFENAVGKSSPPLWLQPFHSNGESSVKKIAASHDMSLADFKKYNLWINGSSLPEGKDYIYYVPRRDQQQLALLRHVGTQKNVGGSAPAPIVTPPKPAVQSKRNTRRFTYLEPNQDLEYGEEYVRVREHESLVEIAVRYKVRIKKLLAYNGFTNYHRPKVGDIVYLKSAKSRRYHIVQEGETITKIAQAYENTTAKIQKKNRMQNSKLYAGQKLSLKKRIKKGSKPTLLAMPTPAQIDSQPAEEVIVERPKPIENNVQSLAYRLPSYRSKMVVHTAVKGESVWRVAKKYNSISEVIKKMNGLKSNSLRPGQKIKVLQIIEA